MTGEERKEIMNIKLTDALISQQHVAYHVHCIVTGSGILVRATAAQSWSTCNSANYEAGKSSDANYEAGKSHLTQVAASASLGTIGWTLKTKETGLFGCICCVLRR